jgi:hypothetical protein
MMFKGIGVVALALLLIALVVLGPFIVIWAFNTLFGSVHTIDYTFWTWLSVIVLGAFISPHVKITKRS